MQNGVIRWARNRIVEGGEEERVRILAYRADRVELIDEATGRRRERDIKVGGGAEGCRSRRRWVHNTDIGDRRRSIRGILDDSVYLPCRRSPLKLNEG